MVDDLPAGPFDVVLIAYNSLFSLDTPTVSAGVLRGGRGTARPGRACSSSRRSCPTTRRASGSVVAVRSMSTSEVVLSISEHDPDAQRAHGHFVSFVDGGRVRLRPWAIRYAPPAELDAVAAAAALRVVERWEDFDRRPFTDDSPRHVTVYALTR